MRAILDWLMQASLWITVPLTLIVCLVVFRVSLALFNWVLESIWVLLGTLMSLGVIAYAVGTAVFNSTT